MKHDHFTRPVRSDRTSSTYGHTRLGEPSFAKGVCYGTPLALLGWLLIGLAAYGLWN